MFPNGLMQQVVRDVVEQTFDVEFKDPVIFPAPLARDAYRIQRRFIRPVAVGVRQIWDRDPAQSVV